MSVQDCPSTRVCVQHVVFVVHMHMYYTCILYWCCGCRQSVLEGALFERQQVINQLASQTAWLGHAQSLIRQLHPLGRDLESVEKQHRSMKGFWVEYEEQMEKMDQVLVASAQLISSQAETDEEKEMIELVILQRARLSEMWGVVQEEAEQAKSIFDKVYPELVNFQSLCTQVRLLITGLYSW